MGVDEREVVTQGPVVVFRWRNEPGWPVEYASPNATEVFGYSAEEFMRGDVAYGDLIAPDCAEQVGREVAEATEAGVSSFVHEPYEILHRDGSSRWLYDATQIERDEHGAATYYVGYVIDVTDRVVAQAQKSELEARLLHAQKLESLGVLAGGVAHDFNNLLTGVLGHASLARRDPSASDELREHLTQIEKLASQAAELTGQLLAYSGRGRFVVRPTDLGELVRAMSSMLDVVISKKAVLEVQCDAQLPAAMVDRAQIQQIVMNLIHNASDALEGEPGSITVRVGVRELDVATLAEQFAEWDLAPDQYVSLVVSDDGSGMTEETKAKLFEPFFSTKVDGRGLGMSAVLGIVRGHRGGLRVSSRVGRGTTFEVLFPVTDEVAEPAERALPEGEWRGQGTVLVVDDQPSVRTIASRILRKFGFETVDAEDGAVALERYREHRDDVVLVLLDLNMPVMDGEETLEHLLRIQPELPVLLTSGYDESSKRDTRSTGRAAGFIQKPYRVEELRAALRAALER